MDHCVAAYAQGIASGDKYVYAIHGSTRATLSIIPSRDGRGWTVDQLLGVRNAPVDHETWTMVQAWLVSNQPDVPAAVIRKTAEAIEELDIWVPF